MALTLFPNWREFVVTAIWLRVPQYQRVTANPSAYGIGGESGNRSERERIDLYAELARFAGEMAWQPEVRERVRSLREKERAN